MNIALICTTKIDDNADISTCKRDDLTCEITYVANSKFIRVYVFMLRLNNYFLNISKQKSQSRWLGSGGAT